MFKDASCFVIIIYAYTPNRSDCPERASALDPGRAKWGRCNAGVTLK